jgi:hypothetical protein
MPGLLLDDPNLEEEELDDLSDAAGAESYFGVPEDAEANPLQDRLRRRQLDRNARIAVAQRRTQPVQVRDQRTAAPVQRAVSTLDVRSRLQADATSKALYAQGKRINSTQTSLAATVVQREVEAAFPKTHTDPLLGATFRGAPLLLLRPERRKTGAAMLTEPQFLGFGVVIGIALASNFIFRPRTITAVQFATQARRIPVGASFPLQAQAIDQHGRPIPVQPGAIVLSSSDTSVADFDSSGLLKGKKAGFVIISAVGPDGHRQDETFEFV